MWYAASEIIFFLVLAAIIGGLIGYGIAQIYQIDFAELWAARSTNEDRSAELVAAYAEIADLRRKLQITTEALRGEDASTPQTELPVLDATAPDEDVPADGGFPPSPSDDHTDEAASGRRLSDRIADAERA